MKTFLERQREQFDRADAGHFEWQTAHPIISRAERRLLAGLLGRPARLLEVGCGEGGNLANLALAGGYEPPLRIGIDLSYEKVRFADERFRAARRAARFVCADAHRLPFADGSFDAVLCRDVLHHVADPGGVVRELARVCAPGGEVACLEPNGRNPLMFALAVARPFERGILRSTTSRVSRLLAQDFASLELSFRQPLPLSRLICHQAFGLPRLGEIPWARACLAAVESMIGAVVPQRLRAYLCFVARAPRPAPPR